MKRKPAPSSRLAALNMLECILGSGKNLVEAEQENTLDDARDRAFSRHLVYGVLRWLTALEWLAGQLLKKPLRPKDRDINRLILIGIYQLWKADSAAHAAIHESAESARKIGKPWAVSMVNAVLRRFQREQTEWLARLELQEERFAHPPWLLAAFKMDWPENWQQIAGANNQPGALWLRLNRQFNTEETIKGLTDGGFAVESHAAVTDAIKISPAAAVGALPGFSEGRISVQDPAAQLTAGLLQLEPGLGVLDACAAPGGKTCHILETESDLDLTAMDLSRSRLDLVEQNLVRLGYGQHKNVRLLAADAAEPDRWWNGVQFDRILLDAPCTATGVIRRHPEIKWLRSPEQVSEAVDRQAQLLNQLWPLLKAGGILLYATCSVLKAENSRQLRQFVDRTSDAERMEINATWGRKLDIGQQILPGEQDMDGFYYARLRKTS